MSYIYPTNLVSFHPSYIAVISNKSCFISSILYCSYIKIQNHSCFFFIQSRFNFRSLHFVYHRFLLYPASARKFLWARIKALGGRPWKKTGGDSFGRGLKALGGRPWKKAEGGAQP
ncbi:uncharacterized protein LOC131032652 [Cryptomeria japonica]|uniref:uncharacterized protein LOC131032652 n=1 Tax=Cryptomeria japonica TaxID=3369 RepID=UPI0027D9F7A6|nr:uncharacterized protein LOC131032652 [Cryptomeria japonica]